VFALQFLLVLGLEKVWFTKPHQALNILLSQVAVEVEQATQA
jgi:hypothetical protein